MISGAEDRLSAETGGDPTQCLCERAAARDALTMWNRDRASWDMGAACGCSVLVRSRVVARATGVHGHLNFT